MGGEEIAAGQRGSVAAVRFPSAVAVGAAVKVQFVADAGMMQSPQRKLAALHLHHSSAYN
jgi:hypothetical protein